MRGVRALTEAQREEIQNRYLSGDEAPYLAQEYNVSTKIVSNTVMQRDIYHSAWISPWCQSWEAVRVAAARRLGYGI